MNQPLNAALACLAVLSGFVAAAEGASFERYPELSVIADKTMVVWCTVADPAQRGAGVFTLENSDRFDSVVLGEAAEGKWMAGSDNFARTQRDQSANEIETAGPETLVQLVIVYDGRQTTIYRDGNVYARYSVEAPLSFGSMSKVLIGLRHEAIRQGGNGYFAGSVEEARLYDVALSGAEVRALRPGQASEPEPVACWTFEDGTARDVMGTFPEGVLCGGAHISDGRLYLDGKDDFMMTPAGIRFAKDFHYRPDTGVLGDVIPYYHDGTYHAFYLHDRAWKHLASEDLVHWRELDVALRPGDDETAPDGEACWTGSIVEHEGQFYLFYTGKNMLDPLGDQKVMRAISSDLVHWTKDEDFVFYADGEIYWSKPVNGPVDDKMNYHHQAFRDPEVFWNAREEQWWLLLHAALADASKAAFALYVSDDLDAWEPREPVYTYPLSVSGDCPNIFPMDGRWYIIAADRHYTWADAPGGPYAPEMVPYGCGELFVPKTMYDGKRRLLLGWVHDREGHEDKGNGVWGGVLSMARELYADDAGRLCQRPALEVVRSFAKPVEGLPERLAVGERLETPPNYMLNAKLALAPSTERAALRFRQSDGEDGYALTIEPAAKRIALGDEHMTFDRVCDVDPKKPLDIRLFAVGTVAECFVNDAYCFTIRTYDHGDGGVTLDSVDGGASLSEIEVFVQE